MENEYLCGLENLEEVWRRVRGEAPPEMPAPDEQTTPRIRLLSDLLDEKYALSRLYCALARCCPTARDTLLHLAAAEKHHFRCLQFERFLLTGKCHASKENGIRFSGTREGLRLAWLRERMAGERLKTEAARCEAQLRETLSAIAEDDEKHAKILYAVLRRSFVG